MKPSACRLSPKRSAVPPSEKPLSRHSLLRDALLKSPHPCITKASYGPEVFTLSSGICGRNRVLAIPLISTKTAMRDDLLV